MSSENNITIDHGCRQVDPIASCISIICVEFLAIRLRENIRVNGIPIYDIQFNFLTILGPPYNSQVRPSCNSSGAVPVVIHAALRKLIDLVKQDLCGI